MKTNVMLWLRRYQAALVLFLLVLLTSVGVFYYHIVQNLLHLSPQFSLNANVVSIDNFYDQTSQAYSGSQYSKTQFSYSVESVNGSTLLVKNVFDVKTPEDLPIFSVVRHLAVNSKTGKLVEGGDHNRSGYIFAPKHLRPNQNFTYWHVNYDAPAMMRYVSQETINGLLVYHYETHFEGQTVDQTQNLKYLDGVGVTKGIRLSPYLQLWIEPVTGRMVKYSDDTVAYYYDLKTGQTIAPWNHFKNSISQESADKLASIARRAKLTDRIYFVFLPVVAAAGVIICMVSISRNKLKKIITLKNLSLVTGVAVITVASISLISWVTGLKVASILFPGTGNINPLSALGLAALGFVVIFKNFKRFKYPMYILCGLLLILSVVQLLYSMNLVGFSLDTIFFKSRVLDPNNVIRISQFATLSFVMLSALPFVGLQKRLIRLRLTEIMCSLVVICAVLTILGQLIDSPEILDLPQFFASSTVKAALIIALAVVMYSQLLDIKQTQLSEKQWVSSSLIATLPIFLTLVFASSLGAQANKTSENDFTSQSDMVTNAIKSQISVYINLLNGAKGLLVSSRSVERSEWKSYADSLDIRSNFPGLQGLGYSVLIKPENKAAVIDSVRAEGYPNFNIKPAGTRSIYSAIIYIEPFDSRNQQAFGFDMYQEPTRRTAMDRAIASATPTMSGKVTLVQEITKDVQPGYLIYVPYYGSEQVPLPANRSSQIVGFVYSPLRAKDFMNNVLSHLNINNLKIDVFDGAETNSASLMYSSDSLPKELASNDKIYLTRTTYLAGRPWTIKFTAPKNYGVASYTYAQVPAILGIGIIVSLSLSLAFYSLAQGQRRAEEYANKITADLVVSKKHLQEKLDETEKLNKFMVDRELKMVELKQKIKQLSGKEFTDVK